MIDLRARFLGGLAVLWGGWCGALAGTVEAVREGGRVVFREGEREVGVYRGVAGGVPEGVDLRHSRGGYLHPLRTPAGHVVTGDFPADHRHHHGVWFAWTKAEWKGRETDFWNLGKGLGGVESVDIKRVWADGGSGCARVGHRYADYSGGVWDAVLDEEWEVRMTSGRSGGRVFNQVDVTVGQRVVSGGVLGLPKYHYGGFAFRGVDGWLGAGGMEVCGRGGVRSREGLESSETGWVMVSGAVGSGASDRASVVAMGHPSNVGFPEPVRMHPTVPYFCFAPQRREGLVLDSSRPHLVSYRLMVVDGVPSEAEVEGWVREWAAVDVSERRCCVSPTSRGYFFRR